MVSAIFLASMFLLNAKLRKPRPAWKRTIEMHGNLTPRIANKVLGFGNSSISSNCSLSTIFQNYLGSVDIRRHEVTCRKDFVCSSVQMKIQTAFKRCWQFHSFHDLFGTIFQNHLGSVNIGGHTYTMPQLTEKIWNGPCWYAAKVTYLQSTGQTRLPERSVYHETVWGNHLQRGCKCDGPFRRAAKPL